MIVRSCELTDRRSAAKRFWFRLLWGFVFAAVFAPLYFFVFPRYAIGLVVVFGISWAAWLATGGYAIDSWRLRCPGSSKTARRLLALLIVLPFLLAAFICAFVLP